MAANCSMGESPCPKMKPEGFYLLWWNEPPTGKWGKHGLKVPETLGFLEDVQFPFCWVVVIPSEASQSACHILRLKSSFSMFLPWFSKTHKSTKAELQDNSCFLLCTIVAQTQKVLTAGQEPGELFLSGFIQSYPQLCKTGAFISVLLCSCTLG